MQPITSHNPLRYFPGVQLGVHIDTLVEIPIYLMDDSLLNLILYYSGVNMDSPSSSIRVLPL
eukprot:SAG22_NODE_16255_length_329_cov_1.752174_1_plen_61_part_01